MSSPTSFFTNPLKSPIPNAGGHAASKTKLFKAGIKATTAAIKGASLIKKENADGVIGVIGGGAIIGALSAKLARVPSVGIVATPTDTRISLKLNPTLLLPESPSYIKGDAVSKYEIKKQYSPINLNITEGNKDNIIDKQSNISWMTLCNFHFRFSLNFPLIAEKKNDVQFLSAS